MVDSSPVNLYLICTAFVQVPVHKFAQYCHKRVERMAITGGKKGIKKPTLEEVVLAKVCMYVRTVQNLEKVTKITFTI